MGRDFPRTKYPSERGNAVHFRARLWIAPEKLGRTDESDYMTICSHLKGISIAIGGSGNLID